MLSFDSPVKTPWHTVSVKWKVLLVLLSTGILFVYSSLWVQALAAIACVLCYAIGGKRFMVAGASRLIFLWPFVLIILVWHGMTHTTVEGVSIALRMITILALSNIMTMTTRLADLLGLLHAGMKPLRSLGINTRPAEIAVAMVVRFTPVFISKGEAISEAWRMRSIKRPAWRLLFPLSLAVIDDAEQVSDALRARGGSVNVVKVHGTR